MMMIKALTQITAVTRRHNVLCRWRSGCTTRTVIGRCVTLTSMVLSAPVKRLAFSTAMWFQSVQYIQSSNTASENTCGTKPSNTAWRLPPSKSENLSRIQTYYADWNCDEISSDNAFILTKVVNNEWSSIKSTAQNEDTRHYWRWVGQSSRKSAVGLQYKFPKVFYFYGKRRRCWTYCTLLYASDTNQSAEVALGTVLHRTRTYNTYSNVSLEEHPVEDEFQLDCSRRAQTSAKTKLSCKSDPGLESRFPD